VGLVHVFAVYGFRAERELRDFIEPTYTDDGDLLPSPFHCEILLTDYEPACIEIVFADRAGPVRDLLRDASYADQWLSGLDPNRLAHAVICVFSPNRVGKPGGSSLAYLGAFPYLVSRA
jgi:hypothetical protein